MSNTQSPSWLYRYACAVPCIALVTVIAGALVTSKNAGMAFRDWPTSDGRGMLAYPWLSDFARNWDKFLEHGHRLAGVMIGLWTIGLALVLGLYETRRWVKWTGGAILLGVIAQGVLGGFRVWLDQRGLAMLHGLFAACVVSAMGAIATSLSPGWRNAELQAAGRHTGAAKPLALMTIALLAVQYVLGGLIRHGGQGLHEHLTVGIVSLLLVIASAVAAHWTGIRWLKGSSRMLLAAAVVQVALGGGAWVTKYGFATLGYVAVADSILQVALRTAHTVLGIVVFATAVVHAVRVLRIDAFAATEVTVLPAFTTAQGGSV